MTTVQSYTPDARRLAVSLAQIYADHPDAQGLPAARRIAATAAELYESDPGADPLTVNTAALFHLAGPPNASNRAEISAAIAAAWLRGADAPEQFVTAVHHALLAAGRADPHENDGDANGRLLWQAAQLDLVSVARHSDYLKDAPPAGRRQEQYRSAYRRDCLLPVLRLRERLVTPAAAAIYDERMPRLAAWLDGRAHAALPADWRRLSEVVNIESGVSRLLGGEDPAQVRSEMPAAGLPYAAYREEQRAVIAGSHERILELTHARIEAARNVAAEKYLESDTIHKPAVEENLFASARRRAKEIGLSAATAEDIARLLLSNAREVQERTLNDIAQRLSRLHGQILDADSPETRVEEADISIPSLVVRSGAQLLARENSLIKELRVTGLNEEHPEQRARFAQWFEKPHPYILTGQIVGSRDADLFMQAVEDGQRCKVIAAMSTDGPMHLGNLAMGSLLIYFRSLGVEISLSFHDASDSRDDARVNVWERLLTLAAAGLDLNQMDAYLQLDRSEVVRTAFQLGAATPLSVLNSALGLRLSSSATDTFLPLLRLADILHIQQPALGGPCRTLVIDDLGGDVYVRMARNIAERFGFIKPSALYLRPMRSLTTYHDPGTGSAVEVMTSTVPQGLITCSDSPEDVRRRIGRAYTGGRRTLAEQRAKGGNPDPRVCSVSSLHAFHSVPEPDAYAALQARCRSGELLCGECKTAAADSLVEQLRQHRRRRDALPKTIRQRARTMAGVADKED